jgi:hypothetical protein
MKLNNVNWNIYMDENDELDELNGYENFPHG